MPTLKDGINYSKYQVLKGLYKTLSLSDEHIKLLEKIKPRQQKKFKSKKLIPYPLLQLFWRLGFLPIMKEPTEGMRVCTFLNFLSKGKYKNKQNQFKGIWLRDKIEAEEHPGTDRRAEKYIGKTTNGKLWPASHLRDLPGTIIK